MEICSNYKVLWLKKYEPLVPLVGVTPYTTCDCIWVLKTSYKLTNLNLTKSHSSWVAACVIAQNNGLD